MVRELLFADGAAFASPSDKGQQSLMDYFSTVCGVFPLAIYQQKSAPTHPFNYTTGYY